MPKYVKATDQLIDVVYKAGEHSKVTERAFNVVYKARGYRLASDVKKPENDYSKLSTEELQDVTNPKLKAYLDEKGVEYPAKANKDVLIELVAGK